MTPNELARGLLIAEGLPLVQANLDSLILDPVPGAHVTARGTCFVVYATEARDVRVRLYDEALRPRDVRLQPCGDGIFIQTIATVHPGALYKLVLDGEEVPDPYARYLPFGVHGPARVVASTCEPALEHAPPSHRWTIYELHVGTFSPEGTYRGAIEKLAHVAALGVSAIELLPIAAFAGARGWGYDGVAPFAPFAPYGEPDDLRALVRAAHERGLAVILDVVYNHFGPAGNYLPRYSQSYFTTKVDTPWGSAPDFSHRPMRDLVLSNVQYWLGEFGFDALRLDATHTIIDASSRHILSEIVDIAGAMQPRRRIFMEDERNDPRLVTQTGADGVWADDLHHQIHALLTGERDGYYAAYEGSVAALAACIQQGWTYAGQPYAPWNGRPRGAPATWLRPDQLVTCIQNHDQIGNRALGTRLSHEAGLDRFALATMLLLFLPTTPLLFMGQEWAATAPFLFFSDHEGELGDAVTKGRRKEFEGFAAFRGPQAAERIPDPQAWATFHRSKLVWEESTRDGHASILALHRSMLHLRSGDPVLSAACKWDQIDASARGQVLRVVRRQDAGSRELVVNFGEETVPIDRPFDQVLAIWGTLEGRRLGALSAVVLTGD